jgi:hypothetical protein
MGQNSISNVGGERSRYRLATGTNKGTNLFGIDSYMRQQYSKKISDLLSKEIGLEYELK